MPPFSAAPVRSVRAHSLSFQDFTGKSKTSRHILTTDTTGPQVAALELALGRLSNARAMGSSLSTDIVQLNPANPLNTTFDEAHATVEIVMVVVWQNDAGEVQAIEVPAPDASLFTSDGSTPDLTNAQFIAYRVAALAAMNEGGGSWAYSRGFRSTRSASSRRARVAHPLAEPGGADLPPIAPGA